jgi:hypothetical protein
VFSEQKWGKADTPFTPTKNVLVAKAKAICQTTNCDGFVVFTG